MRHCRRSSRRDRRSLRKGGANQGRAAEGGGKDADAHLRDLQGQACLHGSGVATWITLGAS
jgi:hypothetical protein